MRDLGFLLLIMGLGVWSLIRPDKGVLIFLALGILNLHSFTWGFGRSIPFALIVAICTFVGLFFSRNLTMTLPRQKEVWVLLILWGLFGISALITVFSDLGERSDLALNQFIQLSKVLVMVFLTMLLLYSKDHLNWLVKVLGLSIGFWALKGGAWVILTGFSNRLWGPEMSFLTDNNAIALAMAMNVPLLFFLIKMEKNTWIRQLMWVMLIMTYPAVVGTFSRGGWLGLAGATGILILRSPHKFWLFSIGGIVLSLGIIFPIEDWVPEKVASRFDELIHYEEDASAMGRLLYWSACLQVGLDEPFFGEGFKFYSPQVYRLHSPELAARIEQGEDLPNRACHSMWLMVFAEHGIFVFSLWLFLLAKILVSLRTLAQKIKLASELGDFQFYPPMLLGTLIVFMISGTFLDFAYFDVYYYLVAAVVLLKELVEENTKSLKKTQHKYRREESYAI